MDHAWITCGSQALGPLGQSIRTPVARPRRQMTARTYVCTSSPFVGGAAIVHMRSHVFSPRSCWMPGPVAQGPRRCPPGSLPIFLFLLAFSVAVAACTCYVCTTATRMHGYTLVSRPMARRTCTPGGVSGCLACVDACAHVAAYARTGAHADRHEI